MNKRGEITTNTKEIETIVRNYQQLYANKLSNQEEIDYLNRLINYEEIEAVIKNFPKNKSPGPDRFSGEFYQTFKEEIMPLLLKLYQKIETEGKLPNSFYEASSTLIPKPGKDLSNRTITYQYP